MSGHQPTALDTIDHADHADHAGHGVDASGDGSHGDGSHGDGGGAGLAQVGPGDMAAESENLDGDHGVSDQALNGGLDGHLDGHRDGHVDGRLNGGLDPAARDSHEALANDEGAPAPLEQTAPVEDREAPGRQLRPVAGASFAELPITAIRANPRQPRQVFDEDALAELVHSIREVGLLQPIVVRPVGDDAYELVMGERRLRASVQAGLDTIPAIVRETGDDELLRDALLENLHRAQLNPLEEAAAYQQLLDDFGCTHDELASRIGRSRPQISNTLRLLRLSPSVQRRVAAGVLSAGHARTLLGLEDAEAQDRLAGRVVAEGISVRGLEEIVAVGHLDGETRVPIRRHKPTAPGLEDLAARLSDRLETRVKVDLGKRKGRITVEFASLPDLERIIAVIDPGHATRTRQESTEF